MPPSYTGLTRAQLSYDYLHSNSTTHEFLFGALAEILDNSRDANASKMDIFTVNDIRLRGGVRLYLLDDGEGMDPTETAKVVTFGLSHKKSMDSKQIGQYGNGLKSGSMRIANDMILFTKKSGIMTCLMLSRTFHEEDKISEVIVPLPSFNSCGLSPVYGKGKSQEHHEIEMALILKYSPFHTREEFLEQFSRIEAESGTLVILYNLKLLDTGVTELDFKTNPEDILIAETDLLRDKILVTEKYSFRAYVALLYSEPRMKVYVQGKKVHAHRLVYDLYKPRTYEYTSSRFKTRAKEVANKAEVEYKLAKQKLKDTEGRAREFEKINLPKLMSSEDRAKLRTLQAAASELRTDVERKKLDYDVQQRSLKEPKTLSFIFGINLENRKNDGLFIYNCNRLIKMYVRVGPQLEGEQKCRGVVGIVNVPYLVLEPTLNKQDFTDGKEYRLLLKVLGEYMDQYWNDVDLGPRSITEFWEHYGYYTTGREEKPSMDSTYVNRRAREKKICLQCDKCLKWRVLPYSSRNVGKVVPDDWICSQNPDTSRNKCDINEEKLNLPEGKFLKIEKTREDKNAEALKRVATDLFKQNQQLEVVASARAAKAVMDEVARRRVVNTPASRELPSDDMDCKMILPDEWNSEANEQLNKRTIPNGEPLSIKRKRIDNSRASTSGDHSDVVYNYEPPPRKSAAKRADLATAFDEIATNVDDWWPELSDEELEIATLIDVGSRVEIQVRDRWYRGTALKKMGQDLIVRLDKLPSAEFDKRIAPNSDKIRLATASSCSECDKKLKLLEKLRTQHCDFLQLFLPPVSPTWKITSEQLDNFTVDELTAFPLEEFFRVYQTGLQKLFQGQLKNELKKREKRS